MPRESNPTEENIDQRPNRLLAFRPLFWWSVIAVFLLAYDYHRLHAPLVRLLAEVYVAEERMSPGAGYSVFVDGKVLRANSPIPIGTRKIRFEAKDTKPFEIEEFIWYGENNMGPIRLPRLLGQLELSVTPVPDN